MAKSIVVTFGRFNPPTAGHHLLAQEVMRQAGEMGADHMIFGSMSADPKKNPLTPEQKAKHMGRVLGTPRVHVGEGAKNPFEMLHHLSQQGYDRVHMVLGSDRSDEGIFKKMQEYVAAGELPGVGKLGIKKLTGSTAGEARSDDAKGLAGVSGTKQRAFVSAGDFAGFRRGLPAHVSEEHARELFSDVASGMKETPKKKVAKKAKKKLKESLYFGPLSFVINSLITEAERKTRVETKTGNNTRKRNQRARDDAKAQGGDMRQYCIVKSKNDEVMIIRKSNFDDASHILKVSSDKMTMGAAQAATKEKKFVQTKSSITLFGKIQGKPTANEKTGGTKKESGKEKTKSKTKSSKKKTKKDVPQAPPTKVPRVTGSKSRFPDDDHAAGDMESGIVAAFNAAMGIPLQKQVKDKLITPEAAKFIETSTTLGDSANRTLQAISEQLSVKHPGSNFVAIHYGATKTEKLSKFWTGYGGVDNTPKSDILFRDTNTGQIVGVSVKCGPSQLMSGKAGGEATATVYTALEGMDKRDLEPKVQKKVQKLIKALKNLVNDPRRTKGGDISDYLKGELKGKDKDILMFDKLHKEAKKDLEDLLSESKEFRKGFVFEALTGAAKFDTGNPKKISPAVAQYILSMNRDGTETSLTQITPEYADKVADALNFVIRFKSSSVKSTEGIAFEKKTGRKLYSYWSVISMVLNPKKLIKEIFTHNAFLNTLIKEDQSTNREVSETLDQLENQIGGDIYSLMQFLEIEPDEFATGDIDFTTFGKLESGFYNTIVIGDKQYEIPVEKNIIEQRYISLAKRFLLEKRNYRKEYDNYQGRSDQIEKRSSRNKARRLLKKMGRVSYGDGKDVDHKNGNPKDNSVKNLRVTSKSHNRSKR